MSERNDPTDEQDEAVIDALAELMARDGDLVPVTEEEVRRFELANEEATDLPPLREATIEAPRVEASGAPENVVPITGRRFAWVTHALALAAGIAGAWLLGVGRGELTPGGARVVPSAEASASTSANHGPTTPPLLFALGQSCTSCCGGKDCRGDTGELGSCASGVSCVPCAADLESSNYRLKFGALLPLDEAKERRRAYPSGVLEVCVMAGTNREECHELTLDDRSDGQWRVLDTVYDHVTLSAGLNQRLHWKGASGADSYPAYAQHPIFVTPAMLCKGQVTSYISSDKKPFAKVSTFLVPAHHVAIRQGESLNELQKWASRHLAGVDGMQIWKLNSTGPDAADGYVLGLPPMFRRDADKAVWTLRGAGIDSARVTLGSTLTGTPLSVDP